MGVFTLKTILIILVSSGVSILLLKQIHRRNTGIFSFIERIPKHWKNNQIIRWIVLLILIIIISVLVVIVGLNETVGTIIIGFLISLTDLIFTQHK